MNIGLALLAVMFWSVFAWMFFTSVFQCANEWSIWVRLWHSGVLTDGCIERRRVRIGGKTGRCCVTYSFNSATNGHSEQAFTHEQQVSWRHYKKLTEGTSITVQFLSFNPNISRLADVHADNTVRDSSTIESVI